VLLAGGKPATHRLAVQQFLGQVGALGDGFEPATEPDCLYLHDLAVGPQGRGLGLGPLLVTHALAQARREGLAWAALVSVQGSQDFWHQQGFMAMRLDDRDQLQALASYAGGPACYMTQALLETADSCQTGELAYSS